jgi:hypothetical protein
MKHLRTTDRGWSYKGWARLTTHHLKNLECYFMLHKPQTRWKFNKQLRTTDMGCTCRGWEWLTTPNLKNLACYFILYKSKWEEVARGLRKLHNEELHGYYCSRNIIRVVMWKRISWTTYEGVSKSSLTGRLERELQMVQISATRCSCIVILWVSLVSFAAITLSVVSQRMFIIVDFVMT